MSRNSWMASVRALVVGSARRRSQSARRRARTLRFRPDLESLETRLAPSATATYTPTGAPAGDNLIQVNVAAGSTISVSTPSNNMVEIVLSGDATGDTFTAAGFPAGSSALSTNGATLTINTALLSTSTPVDITLALGSGAETLNFGLGAVGVTSTDVENVTIKPGSGVDQINLNTICINNTLNVTGGAVVVNPGASITTTGGAINLTGQGDAANPVGVNVDGVLSGTAVTPNPIFLGSTSHSGI